MARGHAGLPQTRKKTLSRQYLLGQLQQIDNNQARRTRVLRLENSFRDKIETHISALPTQDAIFQKFNTSPYVLLIHARQRGYSKVSELEADILPAKQFSSMETSAGRMVEEVVLPEYGWECVASEMHTSNSALDGKRLDPDVYHLATLKSGPRCLNDEMSENFADAIIGNYSSWSNESGCNRIDFTYGVLYGTEKLSNKKDWHILRNIKQKCGRALTISVSLQGFTLTGDKGTQRHTVQGFEIMEGTKKREPQYSSPNQICSLHSTKLPFSPISMKNST
ncbi:hypothetical protein [Leptolyngbya sp. PCC 6406]|uniref:hypothetical protein n=1 Tax=Leptolyngbya sp. PCC 6406 TaxID=1173264 RepID=UPI0002AC31F9|nr:hypothetical protein [Leptolyngbya sp. PCC 6406]